MASRSTFFHLFSACLTVFLSFQLASSSSSSSSSPSFCPNDPYFFLYGLRSQCPFSTSPTPLLQVNGDFLDGIISNQLTRNVAVLFYASWCPFSLEMFPAFDSLNSLFPEIEHLVIEQSSAMPSVFSRYGIYSLPSILILNQTSRVHYRGPKKFASLVQFYQRTTGMEPLEHYNGYELVKIDGGGEKAGIRLLKSLSFGEIVKREAYLVFSLIFLCLRVSLLIFPKILSQLKALWLSHALPMNLQVLGETSQIMGRVLQTVDLGRVWAKLRLSKTRSFHTSARNARVWASSLASVSLGKSSSSSSSSGSI
ncbi:5'-adenylylsulfate reductase-like 5 [Cucurbita pepo subsp. pepo]|uniref:5'-adenylylsulfate reductase-like 5 n=1 Tax=Cucurbita pepo subsp. pepo TaxID=3664 RepID=UPI000C9D3426|nr:5'-adenylylsulfate reductase-like 5 [Cucurbita pepo subsp. pepo]